MTSKFLAPALALTMASLALADTHHDATLPRPDSHAPISVMADHTHKKGEWMVSYRRMLMEMDGNRTGTSSASLADVLAKFPVSPVRMTMRMDMLGAMYAPSDDVTWMLMVPHLSIGMDHVTRTGARFRTEEEGIGDLSVSALFNKKRTARAQEHFTFGWKLPTGELSPRDVTPLGAASLLPYPMRTGGGSTALQLGFTRTVTQSRGTFGWQLSGEFPIQRNNHGYELGDRYSAQVWQQRNVRPRLALGLRLGFSLWDDIEGADARLNPNMIPTARPDLRGGMRLDTGFSVNYVLPRGHRLALEYAMPVMQNLDGPQLETDRVITFGIQRSF